MKMKCNMFHDEHKEFKKKIDIICCSVIISLFLQNGPVDWIWVLYVILIGFVVNFLDAVRCNLRDKKFRKIHNMD